MKFLFSTLVTAIIKIPGSSGGEFGHKGLRHLEAESTCKDENDLCDWIFNDLQEIGWTEKRSKPKIKDACPKNCSEKCKPATGPSTTTPTTTSSENEQINRKKYDLLVLVCSENPESPYKWHIRHPDGKIYDIQNLKTKTDRQDLKTWSRYYKRTTASIKIKEIHSEDEGSWECGYYDNEDFIVTHRKNITIEGELRGRYCMFYQCLNNGTLKDPPVEVQVDSPYVEDVCCENSFKDGEQCRRDDDCANKVCHRNDKVCVPTCNPLACGSLKYCNGESGKCDFFLQLNESCTKDDSCGDLSCIENRCQYPSCKDSKPAVLGEVLAVENPCNEPTKYWYDVNDRVRCSDSLCSNCCLRICDSDADCDQSSICVPSSGLCVPLKACDHWCDNECVTPNQFESCSEHQKCIIDGRTEENRYDLNGHDDFLGFFRNPNNPRSHDALTGKFSIGFKVRFHCNKIFDEIEVKCVPTPDNGDGTTRKWKIIGKPGLTQIDTAIINRDPLTATEIFDECGRVPIFVKRQGGIMV
jgi:predicted secreted protein